MAGAVCGEVNVHVLAALSWPAAMARKQMVKPYVVSKAATATVAFELLPELSSAD
jgi:hypothetical protein